MVSDLISVAEVHFPCRLHHSRGDSQRADLPLVLLGCCKSTLELPTDPGVAAGSGWAFMGAAQKAEFPLEEKL